ncbi:hypothetical protein WG66_004015 [Moniliophthora roreri]|uniref:Uncharacterized protein n=1 Tax=Moniliophthora roreri TaxID=221103 RepID=A0A0W0FXU0_MONRR|nr:hypothetical protein WG66_004015 [Moniliophthora roreri]
MVHCDFSSLEVDSAEMISTAACIAEECCGQGQSYTPPTGYLIKSGLTKPRSYLYRSTSSAYLLPDRLKAHRTSNSIPDLLDVSLLFSPDTAVLSFEDEPPLQHLPFRCIVPRIKERRVPTEDNVNQ